MLTCAHCGIRRINTSFTTGDLRPDSRVISRYVKGDSPEHPTGPPLCDKCHCERQRQESVGAGHLGHFVVEAGLDGAHRKIAGPFARRADALEWMKPANVLQRAVATRNAAEPPSRAMKGKP